MAREKTRVKKKVSKNIAAGVAHDAPALGVHRQVHFGLLVLRVKAGLGIGQAVAGQDDLLLDDDRAAVAL